LGKLESLAMPFRFNIVCAATPIITRDEFIADQTAYTQKLRDAILVDADTPAGLMMLAADKRIASAGRSTADSG
jgi:hypothetical protein